VPGTNQTAFYRGYSYLLKLNSFRSNGKRQVS
jgi:hypothetical protein